MSADLKEQFLHGISIVLVEPSHPGNIGAAARAMKNMGITRLVLVNPREFPHEKYKFVYFLGKVSSGQL